MGYQKIHLSYGVQKCTFDFVRKTPKKCFVPKKCSIGNIVYWLKLLLGALFTQVICTFLKLVLKDGFFDAPFDRFPSLRMDNEPF
jgi:hypothetical protein